MHTGALIFDSPHLCFAIRRHRRDYPIRNLGNHASNRLDPVSNSKAKQRCSDNPNSLKHESHEIDQSIERLITSSAFL
jgi:hypothetical protein